MKVIILAAGKGTRLGCPTDPKSLTTLKNGKSILAMQISALCKVVECEDVYVVIGYLKEKIIENFPNLNFVVNSNFANENTSKSLLKALNAIEEDDVLWINGDVVFHSSIIPKLIKNPRSAMVVSKGAVGEEEVKYRANADGQILEVSKHVFNGEGEAIGINFFLKEDISILKKKLALCNDSDYFEKGIEFCIQQGMHVFCEYIKSNECIEIDFIEDVEKANTIMQDWAYE